VLRRAGRWFNPVTLVLTMACFALPFVAVSCDTPGGYAAATAGGSTSYNGVALAIGGRPDVTNGHERPLPAGEDDRLPPQLAIAAALLTIITAGVTAIGVRHVRTRRAGVAVLALVAAAALLVGQVLVEAELTERISDHLARMAAQGVALDPAKAAHDYVQTGPGLPLCLVLLVLVAVVNGVGWWRIRPRPALLVAALPRDFNLPTAVDPWGT
jgi:hypothetical protein